MSHKRRIIKGRKKDTGERKENEKVRGIKIGRKNRREGPGRRGNEKIEKMKVRNKRPKKRCGGKDEAGKKAMRKQEGEKKEIIEEE